MNAPTLAIGMTTAPRASPTVTRAVSSLRQAGFSGPLHLFAEPDSDLPLPHESLLLHQNAERRGVVENWRRAVQTLLAETRAEWLLLVQDDVIWAPGSSRVLCNGIELYGARTTGILSPYTSRAGVPMGYRNLANGPKWIDLDGRRFWGACAVCLPREAASKLLQLPLFRDYRENRYLDAILDRSMAALDRKIRVHRPSLCDHIGETSTVSPDRDGARGHHEEKLRRGFGFTSVPIMVAPPTATEIAAAPSQPPPLRCGTVFASLATVPWRREMLARTVASLLPQVDRLGVWLNGYPDVPDFLNHPKIEVRRSQDRGDRGSAGKFGWVDEDVGEYRLTCDDDIVYPPDYAARFVHWIERAHRKAIWSVIGCRNPAVLAGAYRTDAGFYGVNVSDPQAVNWVGSGLMGYHSSLGLPKNFMPEGPGRRDEGFVTIWAQTNKVPMYVIPAPANWVVTTVNESNFTDLRKSGRNLEYVREVVRRTGGMKYLAPPWSDPKGFGSFLPALRWAVEHSDGPILELGAGETSTPYLHSTGRRVVTLDSDSEWADRYRALANDQHEIRAIDRWEDCPEITGSDVHWGVVLIDMAPGSARGLALRSLAERADFIVCHDTCTDRLYGYEPALSKFGFRLDDRAARPWTTVVGAERKEPQRPLCQRRPRIVACLATVPWRRESLARTLATLRPQVDAVRVYVNGGPIPAGLGDGEFAHSDEHGDLGDGGKFFWIEKEDCDYYLTCDDDLLYPPDYVQRLKTAMDRRQGPVVLGVHGHIFVPPHFTYETAIRADYHAALAADRSVQCIGTGTAIYRPRDLGLSMAAFPERNNADLQLAVWAQRAKIPMVAIARPKPWILDLPEGLDNRSLYTKELAAGRRRYNATLRSWQAWQTFPDPLRSAP